MRLFLPHREYGYQMIARFRQGNMNASSTPSFKVYPDYFRGKVLHMVSRHQKQQYIAPVLASRLGFICKTVSEVDTDLLGTFSGEVARTLSPVACARDKCKRASAAGLLEQRNGCASKVNITHTHAYTQGWGPTNIKNRTK